MQPQAIQMEQSAQQARNQDAKNQSEVQTALSPIEWIIVGFVGLFCTIIPVMWLFCVKIIAQHERCVHFRFGKLSSKDALGPGLFFFLPGIDSTKTVDMRITTIDVPPQNTMTKDSVPCSVDAVVFYFVTNAIYATISVQNYGQATSLLAQTTLRSVVGDSTLDQLVTARELNAKRLTDRLDDATDKWGIKVCAVEVSDLHLPPDMQKAMAAQAESERERRAKLIMADAEFQSSTSLRKAADILERNPSAIKLRFFQTLANIGTDQMTELYYPIPVNFQ